MRPRRGHGSRSAAKRGEQGLHSDQDHAIAYDAPGGREIDPYFASLAGSVSANLEAAGIPRCPGQVMATERPLRRPIDHRVQAFRGWMSDLGVVESFQASIVFDYRRVAGTPDAEVVLDEVLREAPRHPGFAAHLAHRALDARRPLGAFDRLVTERRRPHVGTLHIKHRGLLIVTGLARALTIGRGIVERSTIGRLRRLRDDGVLDGALLADVEESFRFLWGGRLQQTKPPEGPTPTTTSTLGSWGRCHDRRSASVPRDRTGPTRPRPGTRVATPLTACLIGP